jgi:hypothetical protein
MVSNVTKTRYAIEDTESEVFYAAFDQKPPSDQKEENDAFIEQQSRMEGWNGEAVPDEEGLAEAVGMGDPGDLVGQPLQLAHEREMAGRDRQWQQAVQQRDQTIQALQQKYDPDIQAQRFEQRNNFADSQGHLIIDDAKYDQHMNNQAQLLAERNQAMLALGDVKMQRAHEKYGEPFADAYNALLRNRDHPASHRIIREIDYAVQTGGDPSDVIMHHAEALRGAPREPHFARTREPKYAPRSPALEAPMTYNELEQSEGLGRDDRAERSVFNAIWDDYR